QLSGRLVENRLGNGFPLDQLGVALVAQNRKFVAGGGLAKLGGEQGIVQLQQEVALADPAPFGKGHGFDSARDFRGHFDPLTGHQGTGDGNFIGHGLGDGGGDLHRSALGLVAAGQRNENTKRTNQAAGEPFSANGGH